MKQSTNPISADPSQQFDKQRARNMFIETRLKQRDVMVYWLVVIATYPYHFGMLIADPLLAPPTQVELMYTMHFVMISVGSMLALAGFLGRAALKSSVVAQIVLAGWIAYTLRSAAVTDPEWIVVGSKILTMTIVFELMFCAAHGPFALFALFSYLAVLIWGYAAFPGQTKALVVDMMGIIAAFTGNMMLIRATQHQAGREFDAMMRAGSPHMVAKAAMMAKSLHETFAPRRRFCVCLSSDWREYQALTTRVEPGQLAVAMSDYYTAISEILQEEVANGNYFTDWIADELFIVIYAETTAEDPSLVASALDIASRILATKREFYVKNGFPGAIDIGLSAGDALVGMLGPDSVTKPTALGDIPGRARRMESTGKTIRTECGEQDRIIFGREVLNLVHDARSIVEFKVPSDTKLKDLNERNIFYISDTDSRTQHQIKTITENTSVA